MCRGADSIKLLTVYSSTNMLLNYNVTLSTGLEYMGETNKRVPVENPTENLLMGAHQINKELS